MASRTLRFTVLLLTTITNCPDCSAMTSKPQYGNEHQKARKDAVRRFVPGLPCPYCHKPMNDVSQCDWSHIVDVVLGGKDSGWMWAHSHCNRSAGTKVRDQLNGRATKPSAPVRKPNTCGLPDRCNHSEDGYIIKGKHYPPDRPGLPAW